MLKKKKTSSELNEHVWFVYFDVPEKKVFEMENGCGIELCPCKNACEAKNRCNLHIYNDLFEK